MSYRERRNGGSAQAPAGPRYRSSVNEKYSNETVPAGVIFGCNNKTMMECMQRSLFGLPANQLKLVSRIAPGTTLFLFNFETKNLHGIFEATSQGGLDLDWNAFKALNSIGFPAQVWVRLRHDCTPIHESVFKEAILENYYQQNKFKFELSLQQVSRLLHIYSITQPASASRQSHPTPQYYSQDPEEVPPGTETYTNPPPAYASAPASYASPSGPHASSSAAYANSSYANAPPAYIIVHPESSGYAAASSLTPGRSYYLNAQDRPPGYGQASQSSQTYQSSDYFSQASYNTSWQKHPPYDPSNPSL